jgi:CRISPR-associated protein Csb2
VIGLCIRFTAGRYHATDWEHHVNEGVPEWPPAPWRVLRALVAAAYRLADETVLSLLPELVDQLSELPVYHLPPSAPAHVRHYMPTDDKPVKILDSFIAVGDGAHDPGEVRMWWPEVDLTQAQRESLERLLPEIGYLGRAESWVEISLLDEVHQELNAAPATASERGQVEPFTRLLAVQMPEQLADWLRTQPTAKKKRAAPLPQSVLEVLQADTASLRRDGWSRAPGSRWVDYRIERPPAVRIARESAKIPHRHNGVLFELDSTVLPKIEDTIIVAERMRWALMKSCDGSVPWQISGKDETGSPLQGHAHGHFLPLADASGRITRLLIWANDGFEPQTWAAIRRLAASRRTLYGDGSEPIHLILSGYGDRSQMQKVFGDDTSVLGPSTSWTSTTPFVPPRFAKWRDGRLVGSPREQVEHLCREVLVDAELESARPFEPENGGRFGWNRFTRLRLKDRGRIAPRTATGFELQFAAPIEGPICLGYGSHFGLGRFEAR